MTARLLLRILAPQVSRSSFSIIVGLSQRLTMHRCLLVTWDLRAEYLQEVKCVWFCDQSHGVVVVSVASPAGGHSRPPSCSGRTILPLHLAPPT